MYEDALHRPILITGRGLYRIDGKSWELLLARKSPKDPLLYSFAEGRDGSYWTSSMGGVTRIRNNELQTFTKQNGLTDVLIYDMLTDREGNIWMASNGEGLFRFSGAAFTAVDERMGLKGTQVSSIAQDGRGVVYFGTYDGGLYRYEHSKATPMTLPGGEQPPVTSLVMHSNKLWIGTTGIGLWEYDVPSGAMKRYIDERLGGAISTLVGDENGLWITSNKNAAYLSQDSLKILRIKAGQVEGVVVIGKDSVLLSTTEGLRLYRNDSTYPFITHSAADSAQIVCMGYRDGKLWLGSSDNGLFGYDVATKTTIHISKKDGLRSDFIYNVYAAPNGYVWAGTGYGICRIKPGKDHSVVTFYGRSAGITGMESDRNAVLALYDGTIWFGTTGGALLYNPADAPASTLPVSIQLQRIQLFGESIKDTSWYKGTSAVYGVPLDLRLPWQQNNLTFTFSAISLMGDEGITYRYRVVGLSAPWSEWSPNNTVTFSALPPGQYILEVQCSTDGIHALPKSLQYRFEIITPFHKTTLFRLLLLGACILLGIAIQYALARRKRARLALIESLRREEQAKVRQRTAEDFHDEVGNKITRINVLTNVLRSKIGVPSPDATRIIDQIQDNAGQLYSGTRDILWSLQPSNDSLYQVLQRIKEFGHDLFGDTEITFEMTGIDPTWKAHRMPMDASRNLIMIFKEALNNTLKYANADKVLIDTHLTGDTLTLTITDDGEGFDEGSVSRGQGLINMKTRAKRLGGTLECKTAPGAGTSINLTLKIPPSKI
jgi:signal transduction histidine kinase/sugar lactone lactonase YvrE